YRVEKDDPARSRVTITLITPDGNIPEEHSVGPRGITSRTLIRLAGQVLADELQYIDEKNRPCPQENALWEDTLAAASVPVIKYPSLPASPAPTPAPEKPAARSEVRTQQEKE